VSDRSQKSTLSGALRDLIRLGNVIARDGARIRVDFGDVQTGPIPFTALRAGTITVWAPPAVGEQVLVFMPEGDIERALAGPAVACDAFAPPVSHDGVYISVDQVGALGFDPEAGEVALEAQAGIPVRIEATAGLTIRGDVTVEGSVQVSDTLTADTDVVAAGKSLKTHKHLGVTAGSAVSGAPQ